LSEIYENVKNGLNVVVFTQEPHGPIKINTGRQNIDNDPYDFSVVDLAKPVELVGKEHDLVLKNRKIEDIFNRNGVDYESYLNSTEVEPILFGKARRGIEKRIISGFHRPSQSSGVIVFLPEFDYSKIHNSWGHDLGAPQIRDIVCDDIITIVNEIRALSRRPSNPDWTHSFRLPQLKSLETELQENTAKIVNLDSRSSEIREILKESDGNSIYYTRLTKH
jgi:hypothetical protein